MIVTDHSPCPPEMKRTETGRFDLAWGGIASLSIALSIIHTEASRRGFSLDHIARWMSAAPAALAGLSHKAGSLEAGCEANFILFDTDSQFTVTTDKLHYRHPISAYMGETLRGTVKATYLRGKAIYQDGLISDTPHGHEVTL
jgi:allantoinase